MAIKLNVPFVTQLGIGGHVTGAVPRDDPTGCWYASACMVAYYFEAGPRLGLPALFNKNLRGGKIGHRAIQANEQADLAKNEGLEPVVYCGQVHDYTLEELEGLLGSKGPITFGWKKGHGGGAYGHRSVLIGTDDRNVLFHDPENAPNSQMTIAQFNVRRFVYAHALMQRRSA